MGYYFQRETSHLTYIHQKKFNGEHPTKLALLRSELHSIIMIVHYSEIREFYISGQLHWLLREHNLLLTFDVDYEQSKITYLQRYHNPELSANSFIEEFKGKLHYVKLTKHYLSVSYLDYTDNSMKFSMERTFNRVEHTYPTCLSYSNIIEKNWNGSRRIFKALKMGFC